jgi:hypothetical protein
VLLLAGGNAERIESAAAATFDADAHAVGPPVGARVLDHWGNPVSGIEVTFSIDGIGPIGRSTSGADGIATIVGWTVPAVGGYQILVNAVGVQETARFGLIVHNPPPALLTAVRQAPPSAVVGSFVELFVQATDAAGFPAPNAQLTWASSDYSGVASTDETGFAHIFAVMGKKTGPNTIVVRASSNASVSFTIQGTADGLYRVIPATESASAPAGTTVDLRFTAFDRFDNLIPGTTLYAFNTGTNAQITASAVTDVRGVATFALALDPLAGPNYVWVAVSPSRQAPQVAVTTIFSTASHGAIRRFFAPDCIAPFFPVTSSVAVGVFGPNGHFVPQVPIVWTLAQASGMIAITGVTSTTQLTALSDGLTGVSQVSWTPPKLVGTYQLTATAPQGYDGSPITFTCQFQ